MGDVSLGNGESLDRDASHGKPRLCPLLRVTSTCCRGTASGRSARGCVCNQPVRISGSGACQCRDVTNSWTSKIILSLLSLGKGAGLKLDSNSPIFAAVPSYIFTHSVTVFLSLNLGSPVGSHTLRLTSGLASHGRLYVSFTSAGHLHLLHPEPENVTYAKHKDAEGRRKS